MLAAKEREIFDNITLRIPSPEGIATIIIVEESPGKIYKIFFSIGKAGAPTNAWANALAEMTVAALQGGMDLTDVIISLSNITSSRTVDTPEGMQCRSGPEALYMALLKYRSMNEKKKSLPANYRPARFTNRRTT